MTTDVLLLPGVAAAVTFLAVLLIEGVLRPGYDPIYHTASELQLGERGWAATRPVLRSTGTRT